MKTLLAGLTLTLMTHGASAEIFAMQADRVGNARIVTELDTQRGNCSTDHQYARVTIREEGVLGATVAGEGCWFLMPGSQVAVRMTDSITGRESVTHHATADFFTQKAPDFWRQFTPDMQAEYEPAKPKRTFLPANGPVAGIRVPFEGGAFHLVYELSRRDAPTERCNGMSGRAVLISAISDQTYPRAIRYADGCWYTNRAQDVIIIARAMREPIDFVHSYPAEDFDQAEDFWQVAIGAQ